MNKKPVGQHIITESIISFIINALLSGMTAWYLLKQKPMGDSGFAGGIVATSFLLPLAICLLFCL